MHNNLCRSVIFPMSLMVLTLLLAPAMVWGAENVDQPVFVPAQENPLHADVPGYVADLRVHSAEEFERVLERVDELFNQAQHGERFAPVVFLMHGDEARVMFKASYPDHKRAVDLAAKLSAFGVIDIQVCDYWLDQRKLPRSEMQPFVDFVPFAPKEKKRLISKENYSYF